MRVTVKAPIGTSTTEGDLPAVVRSGCGPLQLTLGDYDQGWFYAIVTLTPTEALCLIDSLGAALGHGREVTGQPDDADLPGPDDDTITLERSPEPPVRPPCACLGAGCSECAR